MNINELKKQLESMVVPEIEVSKHRSHLRHALLSHHGSGAFRFDSGYFNWKNIMLSVKKIVPAGVVVALIAIVIIISFNAKDTEPVSAKELAEKSYQAVADLTLDEKTELEKNMQANEDLIDILEQAKSVEVLKMYTFDEYEAQSDGEPHNMVMPTEVEGVESTSYENLYYLQFTDQNGEVTVIGIDPDTGLPGMLD